MCINQAGLNSRLRQTDTPTASKTSKQPKQTCTVFMNVHVRVGGRVHLNFFFPLCAKARMLAL